MRGGRNEQERDRRGDRKIARERKGRGKTWRATKWYEEERTKESYGRRSMLRLKRKKGNWSKWNRMGRDEVNEMWMWRDGEKSGEKGRFRKTV